MRTTTIASALILSFALIGAAQAQTPRGDSDNTPFQGVYGQVDASAPSRAQVEADLQQARAAGLVAFGDSDNVPFHAQSDNGVSRALIAEQASQASVHGAVAFGDTDNQPFNGV
jgi:hypothetical protein